jgi:O-antigen/teichoic acid export membrane protein
MSRLALNFEPMPGWILSEVARDAGVVFLSTLVIQATAFVVIALSGVILATGEFARLSIIVAATMLASALFELGLGLTVTKKYKESGDEVYLQTAFTVWLLVVPLAAVLGLGVALLASLPDFGLGIGLGGMMNIWAGLRSTDQARQDYGSFARSGFAFAGVRLAASAAALLVLREPVAIALALYAVPMLVTPLSSSFRFAARAFSGPLKSAAEFATYAMYVYLNAVAFIATPYIPQFVIAARADPVEVGTYGLALTFTGPLSLLVYSLRSVLLPKMLGPCTAVEDLMWSRRGLGAILAAWAALMAGGVLSGYGLDVFYGHKFPDIRPVFLIFFTGFSATAMIGLYSLSVQTQGVPQVSMAINVAKLAVLAILLAQWGGALLPTVALTAGAMAAGELALVAELHRRRLRWHKSCEK